MKKKAGKEIVLFFLLVVFSLFLLFFDQKGWLSPFRRVVEGPILTLQLGFYNFKSLGFQVIDQLGRLGKNKQEIEELKGRLRQLAVEQNKLSSCLEENEKMRRLLGAPLPPSWKFMDARVVGISEKMRIDRGKKDGVREGMVVVSENILIGRVVSVGRESALVQLVGDPSLKIPVVVKKPGLVGVRAQGLLTGQFGRKLILDRLLQGEDVQKGDLVVTSGDGGWLPDLLVGQVREVLPKSAEVYQKAWVSSLIDYNGLRIVFLVLR